MTHLPPSEPSEHPQPAEPVSPLTPAGPAGPFAAPGSVDPLGMVPPLGRDAVLADPEPDPASADGTAPKVTKAMADRAVRPADVAGASSSASDASHLVDPWEGDPDPVRDKREGAGRRQVSGRARSAVTITPAMGVGMDLVLLLLFAAIGRRSHEEGMSVVGVLGTWWPFALGALVGWAVVFWRTRRFALPVGPGITVWLCAVLVGMILRAVTGAGVAFSFILVALIVTGVMLVGWRYVAEHVARGRMATPGTPGHAVGSSAQASTSEQHSSPEQSSEQI